MDYPLIGNEDLIESLYEAYKKAPSHVDPSWQRFFSQIDGGQVKPITAPPVSTAPSDQRIGHLIEVYRRYGHLLARVNPLALQPIEEVPQLTIEALGFTADELSLPFPTLGILPSSEASLEAIIQALRGIYCNTVGVEYVDAEPAELVQWIRAQIEPSGFTGHLSLDDKKKILDLLNKSEQFESFLHTKYVGQKRFSLEGCETLIPMLAAIIDKGSAMGMEEVVLGMSHRGRLNVLSNILQKSYKEIFAEFEEGYIPESIEGSGDVKYHKGYFSAVLSSHGHKIKISLTPNPSHLESVDPVVEGQARGKQFLREDEAERRTVFPILVHGDAALSGQGIVYETLQLYKLPGYRTGGTIHLVINNQIGFTTVPTDARSTLYCTDIARAFNIPVFHVNAENPEEMCLCDASRRGDQAEVPLRCRRLTSTATGNMDITKGMNRRSHSRSSISSSATNSRSERSTAMLSSSRVLWRKTWPNPLQTEFKKALQKALEGKGQSKGAVQNQEQKSERDDEKKLLTPIKTGVPLATLKKVTERFTDIPSDFHIHPKLKNLVLERAEMGSGKKGAKPIDWGMGEFLAYGTLLWEGVQVRIAGQDVCRGTFSHRHAVWMDQEEEKAYFPLSHLKAGQGRFEIVNSSLSEMAALGFEYGYSLACTDALVIWEAQFGDFANGAQVIIDQFIMSGEQKWGQRSRLVLLLPHGYEGQGPEHSSARMERFLTLSGHNNAILANPTTPAQLFHLLRRQVLLPIQKPLVVFTPKGLLRYPACVSDIHDLVHGSFQEVIDDPAAPKRIKRLILCSGRVYYDLLAEREKHKKGNLAIVRIEQLYPLNQAKLQEIIDKYTRIHRMLLGSGRTEEYGCMAVHPALLGRAADCQG